MLIYQMVNDPIRSHSIHLPLKSPPMNPPKNTHVVRVPSSASGLPLPVIPLHQKLHLAAKVRSRWLASCGFHRYLSHSLCGFMFLMCIHTYIHIYIYVCVCVCTVFLQVSLNDIYIYAYIYIYYNINIPIKLAKDIYIIYNNNNIMKLKLYVQN